MAVEEAAKCKEEAESAYTIAKGLDVLKEYGPKVLIFHVTCSAATLGAFYYAIDRGVDVPALLRRVGLRKTLGNRFISKASTFGLALACNRITYPLRLALTLACAPFVITIKPPK